MGARLTRRAREEYLTYFDRSATMSDAKRMGSAGMHRRPFPERGASTAETPERKGREAGLPDPHSFWLGFPERGASTAETPERKGREAGLPDPHSFWLGNAA